jgi:hypothetical protein
LFEDAPPRDWAALARQAVANLPSLQLPLAPGDGAALVGALASVAVPAGASVPDSPAPTLPDNGSELADVAGSDGAYVPSIPAPTRRDGSGAVLAGVAVPVGTFAPAAPVPALPDDGPALAGIAAPVGACVPMTHEQYRFAS